MEDGPTKIKKRIIHRVTRYPTLDRPKTMRSDAKEAIDKNIGALWNKRGMTIDIITDPLIVFLVRIIAYKFFQSRRLNSVPCMAMDLGYKTVKKDLYYDLAKLQLQQLSDNLGAIRKTKSALFKFSAIVFCIFFYVKKTFPSFGKVAWKINESFSM